MRLKRNTTPDGMCKYSIIEHEKGDKIEHGLPESEDEFFVIKLKDRHSYGALRGYLESVVSDDEYDPEYAYDLQQLMKRAGHNSPFCKDPD